MNRDTIVDELRKLYPHGHPDFLPTTVAEIDLHDRKNHDYAKGGHALGNFTRVAAILANYPNLKLSDQRVVALVYALKQLDAVLWGLNSNIEHKVEGLNERLQDISVYSKIVMCMNTEAAQNREIDRQFGVDLQSAGPQYGYVPGGRDPEDAAERDAPHGLAVCCMVTAKSGMACCRPGGHDGDHVARIQDGKVIDRWRQ